MVAGVGLGVGVGDTGVVAEGEAVDAAPTACAEQPARARTARAAATVRVVLWNMSIHTDYEDAVTAPHPHNTGRRSLPE